MRILLSAALAVSASLTRLSHQSSRGIVKQDSKRFQGQLENAGMSTLGRSKRQNG
jgi:hypothetical protein